MKPELPIRQFLFRKSAADGLSGALGTLQDERMLTTHRSDVKRRTEWPRRATTTPTTAVIIDESDAEDNEGLLSQLAGTAGPIEIVVTRRRPPSPIFASGGGIDGPIMWSESHNDHRRKLQRTNRRVEALASALQSRGLGPVTTIDALPSNHFFRSATRRQTDGLVRSLRNASIVRAVVEPCHDNAAELEAALVDQLAQPEGIRID